MGRTTHTLIGILCLSVVVFACVSSIHSQTIAVRDEYLKILPFRSTIEDVAKTYGEGKVRGHRPEVYLSKDFTTKEGVEVWIDFFKDCRKEGKVGAQRQWIVESVLFTFDERIKLQPQGIYLRKQDFTRFLYGDVYGQIIYQSKDKRFQFDYLCGKATVSSLNVGPTAVDRKEFSCYQSEAEFELDPAGFTEIEQDSEIRAFCRGVKSENGQ